MSNPDPRAPVIVGAGQITHRDDADPTTPLELMIAASRASLDDTGSSRPSRLLGAIDSVAVTHCLSWPAPDPARALADELGASPGETVRSMIAGTSPIELLGDAAARISAGELDVALLAGGEAARSLARGTFDGGATPPDAPEPSRVVGVQREPSHPAEHAAGVFLPVNYYPLYETALRGAAGRDPGAHTASIARLWERFGAVAKENPHAWIRDPPDAKTIATPAPGNRPIAHPYTKLMTANIHVDQGAALVICSVAAARAAGIPPERWVFCVATAAAHDRWFTIERDALHRSPAIGACGRAALGHAGVDIDDVAHLDLYSCFPSAVQIAAAEIGLDLEHDSRPPTVTGGLTFAGGPASNYSMHALAGLTRRLREEAGARGLASGVGWFMTKHALAVLAADPPARPFAHFEPQSEVDALASREAASNASGRAPIESYTVVYDTAGAPNVAIVSSVLRDGRRALAASRDAATMGALLESDPIGRDIHLDGAAGFALADR